MNITINQSLIEKNDLTVDEFIVLMCMSNHYDLRKSIESLIKKGLVIEGDSFFFSGYNVIPTDKGRKAYNNIALSSDNPNDYTDEALKDLATKLKEIYPKGKKDGRFYWADGVSLIMRRLKIFFRKYGKRNPEDIIDATKRYVEEKEGQTDMRLLKYFIFKEAVGKGGEVEPSSDLLNYMENKDESDNSDWMLDVKEEKASDVKIIGDPFE